MNDSFESKLEQYLEAMKHQWTCNLLGEDPGDGFYTKMDSIWNSLTPEQQDEFERRWDMLREQLNSPPAAPKTLGMVDQIAGNGIHPRKRVICPGCCYSDGIESSDDGSWFCHRCGDAGEI